jgi:6-phosphogluconate dehydrogenase (decarboxylating)
MSQAGRPSSVLNEAAIREQIEWRPSVETLFLELAAGRPACAVALSQGEYLMQLGMIDYQNRLLSAMRFGFGRHREKDGQK